MLKLEAQASKKVLILIITNVLWKNTYVMRDYNLREEEYRECEAGILSLNLPNRFKEKLKKKVKSTYNDSLLYLSYLIEHYQIPFNRNLILKLCFTSKGDLDYKMSTLKIIQEENLNINCVVDLACGFCLESEILKLWKTESEVFRELTMERRIWCEYLETNGDEELDYVCWTDRAKLKEAFLAAVQNFNFASCDYFFKKMLEHPSMEKCDILNQALGLINNQVLSARRNCFREKVALFLVKLKRKVIYGKYS